MDSLPPALLAAVQHNCDIADALHAGDYSLCTYLLKMREFFRWERRLPFSASLPKEDVGAWVQAREQRWAGLENASFSCLPLDGCCLDPFDSTAINARLEPRGWVYSAGYGYSARPTFFLGKLLAREDYDSYQVHIAGAEQARDLAAPPAMSSQGAIYVRRESIRRMLHDITEAWRWRGQPEDAWARALRAAGWRPQADAEAALEQLTDGEVEMAVWHEVGEVAAGALLPGWEELLLQVAGQRQERVARAVRDHLADSLTTLPVLLQDAAEASLHIYFANFSGLRRELFPQLHSAYQSWVAHRSGLAALKALVAPARRHWQDMALGLLHQPPEHWPVRDEHLDRLRPAWPA
jgi:hypothetical protein